MWIGSEPTSVTNNIVVGSQDGYGIYFDQSWETHLECNDVWANQPGDYFGVSPGLHDISVDPEFCDPGGGDYSLCEGSPCSPDQQPECGLIGAFDVGCGPTATVPGTWGLMKRLFDAPGVR